MKLAALWSGGKDSSYATFLEMKEGHEIKYLVSMFPERVDSYMFHRPCIELTVLQAEAFGIEQIIGKTKGEKEKELDDLRKILDGIKDEIDGIVSGAVASQYQKSRIEKICGELGLKSIAPLWQKDPEKILRDEIRAGFEIIFTGVFADGFDRNWLGRKIDEKAVNELVKLSEKKGISIAGEGGEYESLVINCPLFKKRIEILESEISWDEKTNSGYLIVNEARLV